MSFFCFSNSGIIPFTAIKRLFTVIRMDAGRVLGYGPPREEDVQLFNEES